MSGLIWIQARGNAVNSLPTFGVFLLKAFADSSDSDQARRLVGPDLDTKCLTLYDITEIIFPKIDLKK